MNDTALPLVDAGLRGGLIALLLLLVAGLRREHARVPAARIALAFCAGLAVQALSSTPAFEAGVPRLWQAPLVGISVGNAVLFWLFVQALCDDDFALRPWQVGAWLLAVLLGTSNCASGFETASAGGRIALAAQRAVPLVCAVLAAIAAAATWRLDLVEKRRRLRAFIVVTGIAYTLTMLGVRLAAPQGRVAGTAASLDMAALLAMVGVVAASLLRIAPSELFPPSRDVGAAAATADEAPPVPLGERVDAPPDAAETRLAEALSRAMRADRAYRLEGLTVAGLAQRLDVPEYRLRRHINRRLGHRNFNAYVNGFRLDEARAALADPARRALPVLTIALDAGFQSIGPFNRAFKAATGQTPSEFRRRHDADS